VVFELVVGFDLEAEEAVAEAEALCVAAPGPVVRGVELPLLGPWTTRFVHADPPYVELSVGVTDLRFGGGPGTLVDVREVTPVELAAVGRHLYDLLRQFRGHRVAMVGWDPEEVVHQHELRERIEELGLDRLDGLVIAEDLAASLGIAAALAPFEAGYLWLPPNDNSAP
jgi:hypothetical protein